MKFIYCPPNFIKRIYNDFYWETGNNKILLTFDDGPTKELTEGILSLLNDLKIKALFFCVGENIKKYPNLTSDIISEGHRIGNHSYSHKRLNKLSEQQINFELDFTSELLLEKNSYEVKYFRPPYGRFNSLSRKIVKSKNLKTVMWSLLTWDFKKKYSKVKYAIENYLSSNSIVVLHDNRKSEKIIFDSIKLLNDTVLENGYEFGAAEECLK